MRVMVALIAFFALASFAQAQELFIFPNEAPRSFWMKNTRIPLDIMYFDKELEMVSISADTPPCRVTRCPTYPSKSSAMYVLELNAGMAKELGVGEGDKLTLKLD